ncbi:unnamed protein product [Amoebophrya sp. A120]|nr:unnamed protein product [Amoebophrya sp. A120]|eukprot:GSA120T00000237001.1
MEDFDTSSNSDSSEDNSGDFEDFLKTNEVEREVAGRGGADSDDYYPFVEAFTSPEEAILSEMKRRTTTAASGMFLDNSGGGGVGGRRTTVRDYEQQELYDGEF